MKTITKNTKRVLSMFIALALLLGSMVISNNVGVSITASAETETGITVEWDGKSVAPADTESTGEADDPIEIATPAELLYISNAGTDATVGKHYIIADGIAAFDMKGFSGVTIKSTDDVSTLTPTSNNWGKKNGSDISNSSPFSGCFNGNGITIFNLYGAAWGMGLFPYINPTANDVIIENVTVKNSYFVSNAGAYTFGAGGIFGYQVNTTASKKNIVVKNCAVINTTVKTGKHNDNTQRSSGAIGGYAPWRPVEISNCFVKGVKLVSDSTSTVIGGLVGSKSQGGMSVNNSIIFDVTPYQTGTDASANYASTASYNKVYTNKTALYSGIITLNDSHNGALSGTELSNTYWLATANTPELKGAHKFNTVNNNDGTHSATCTCCSSAVVGLAEKHFYDLDNAEGGIASCSCGASVAFTSKIWNGTADDKWDGEGTKEKPYIIRTPEQLYAMVQSEGYKTVNDVDIPLYFKVADGIDTFYLNDTINYNSAKEFAGAIDTMTNWSKNLIIASDGTCQDPDCPAKSGNHVDTSGSGSTDLHYNGYIYTFLGHFDGNGVTISGLYSKTDTKNIGTSFYPGTGFFPGMSDNASIANVTFDVSYIENLGGSAAVVTSSFGTTADKAYYYGSDARCTYFTTRYAEKNNVDKVGASITLSNVAVKNAYLTTTYKNQWTANQNIGGLLATQFSADSVSMNNCLFDARNSVMVVNESTTPLKAGMFASSSYINEGNSFYNCVTLSNDNIDNIASNYANTAGEQVDYIVAHNSYALGSKPATAGEHGTIWTTELTVDSMPLLNWATWDTETIMPNASADGFTFKDYKYYRNNFKNSDWYMDLPYGSYSDGNSDPGMFFKYNTLVGSGTESDPYLISDADTLFQVIAAGGMHRGNPQHFKLTNDIDIGGTQWVKYQDQSEDDIRPATDKNDKIVYYAYRNFGGVLDGDGYTVTGLYSATNDATAGLIPTLDGGTVTNLHIRNGYVYSGAADAQTGLIAGSVINNGKITNCSVADCASGKLAGNDSVCENCIDYVSSTPPTINVTTTDSEVFYGIQGKQAQLLSRALKMPCADIDGDGLGEDYSTADLTSLRNKLLNNQDYKLIYADANRDNSVDIRDLAMVKREMVKDEFTQYDGFWRLIKGGSVAIYFSDNDDYDAARKLELFFESQVPGLDMQKYGLKGDVTLAGVDTVDAIPTTYAIVVNSSNATTGNYSINYNAKNAVLELTGDNFTAAYEAAEYFATNSNASTGKFVKDHTGALTSTDTATTGNKMPVSVEGKNYYYAWGDEFNEAVCGTVNYDTWLIRDKGGDTADNDSSAYEVFYESNIPDYINLKLGSDEMLPILNVVENGKLYMHRGVEYYEAWENAFGNNNLASYASNTRDDDSNKVAFDTEDMASGGILQTKNSMLYRKGYAEFKASVPNDEYAFPAWWLYTTPGYNNRDIDLGLYSKVLPINQRYNNRSIDMDASDVTSYKYEVPTFFIEVDAMEIVNQGKLAEANQSSFHKWYNLGATATTGPNNPFEIYDLDWDTAPSTGGFTNRLASIDANYNIDSDLTGFGDNVRGAGNRTLSVSLGHFDCEDGYTTTSADNLAANGEERIYGFLWEDDLIKFYIYKADRTLLWSTVVEANGSAGAGTSGLFGSGQKGYVVDTADGYSGKTTFGQQYAHMLIDNHLFPFDYTEIGWNTKGYTTTEVKEDAVMTVEYARIYQLDGAKDIVTTDTEAFNTNDRLG